MQKSSQMCPLLTNSENWENQFFGALALFVIHLCNSPESLEGEEEQVGEAKDSHLNCLDMHFLFHHNACPNLCPNLNCLDTHFLLHQRSCQNFCPELPILIVQTHIFFSIRVLFCPTLPITIVWTPFHFHRTLVRILAHKCQSQLSIHAFPSV